MELIELGTWSDFRSWIDKDLNHGQSYWRGQSEPAWPLASSFEREILGSFGGGRPGAAMLYPYDGRYHRQGRPIWEPGTYSRWRDAYLQRFQQSAAGLRGSNPAALTTDQWWALGRHYGLVTPLLDWTTSPFVAAFFALTDLERSMRLESKGSGLVFTGRQVAIFRLFHNGQLEGDGLRVVRPTVEELGRMHGQRGMFTWLDSEQFFELQSFLESTGRGNLLTKVVLSDQALLGGLKDLHLHGIDYRLLFPDLAGAAMAANSWPPPL